MYTVTCSVHFRGSQETHCCYTSVHQQRLGTTAVKHYSSAGVTCFNHMSSDVRERRTLNTFSPRVLPSCQCVYNPVSALFFFTWENSSTTPKQTHQAEKWTLWWLQCWDRDRDRQQGYQPSWHHQDVIYLCSTGHWDTSSCLSGRDWQPRHRARYYLWDSVRGGTRWILVGGGLRREDPGEGLATPYDARFHWDLAQSRAISSPHATPLPSDGLQQINGDSWTPQHKVNALHLAQSTYTLQIHDYYARISIQFLVTVWSLKLI